MNVISGRHMFWQAPATGGVLRTVPFRHGGRPVMMGGGMFMGQTPINRLDAVSIPAIIGRIQLAPVIQAYIASLNQANAALGAIWGGRPQPKPIPSFPPMTEAEKQILFEVSKNPTDEELKDLATIDNLFSSSFNGTYTTTSEVCYLAHSGYRAPGGFGRGVPIIPTTGQAGAEATLVTFFHPAPVTGRWQKAPTPPDISFTDDKFWCSDPSNNQPSIYLAHMPQLGKFGSFASMFGIDVNKTWGEEKLATKNGLTILDVKSSYPLPPPLDMAPDFIWNMAAAPHLVEMANLGVPVDPEAFRAWYTMAVLTSYDAATDAIIAEQKRKAKKAKRKAIISGIAIAIAGIVLSFIVPGIIAAAITAIKSAVQLYIAAKERQKAAKAMAEAAKMFEADAPAFANEVQKAADMMDEAAAQEEASQPLTQEQLDAIQEVKDNPEPGTGPSTGQVLVTGGAAVGVVAAMLAIFR